MCAYKLQTITSSNLTQKPHVLVSEFAHTHEAHCASLNAKVRGMLMMLSLMKPGKNFSTIVVSFMIIVHSSCSALQYMDAILTSLHSFI